MSSVCVIPARGGSKRIPRKNVREFCGRPIIAYSVEAALESGLFDEVMVSTDDEEIAGVARGLGADVPFMRSARTSGDMATTADVLLEVLGRFEDLGRRFDVTCCLYATAPFVSAQRLREAWGMLEGADSVVSVAPFSFPPQRGFVEREGRASWWMPENAQRRSQDLEVVYHDAGQLYLCRTERLASERSLVCGECRMLVLPEAEVQDIDNESDWVMAEAKYRMLREGE